MLAEAEADATTPPPLRRRNLILARSALFRSKAD